MLMGPTLLFTRELASAAKPKAEQLREHRGMTTVIPSPSIKSRLHRCLKMQFGVLIAMFLES